MYKGAALDELSPFAIAATKPSAGTFFVDLGNDIGSSAWWRGMVSLVVMLVAAFLLATSPAKLPTRAYAPLPQAQMAALAAISIAPLSAGGRTGARVAPTVLVQPLSETPERPHIELTAELGSVDSFGGALRRAGVSMADIAEATSLIEDFAEIGNLKPGTEFDIVLGRRSDKTQPRPLDALSFRAALDLKIDVSRGNDGKLFARRIPIRIDDTPLRITGMVGDSLYKSARAAGLPSRVVANFIKALSPRVNFQRNVYASDEFDVVVAHRRAETGESETGDLLYARLAGPKKDLEIAAWEKGGKLEYFLPDGKGVKEGMSATPVRGARESSGFGVRNHPILKRTRMHKGLDYAARAGSPIEATAAGTVIFAGRNGGYGNQVRVRHANGIVTSYSHMKDFGPGIRSGAHVNQGDKVGYVGSTGMSTGPHLHYEVLVAGRAVNPKSQTLPTGLELTGGELRQFQSQMARLRSLSPSNDDVEDEAANAG